MGYRKMTLSNVL